MRIILNLVLFYPNSQKLSFFSSLEKCDCQMEYGNTRLLGPYVPFLLAPTEVIKGPFEISYLICILYKYSIEHDKCPNGSLQTQGIKNWPVLLQ